MDIITHKYEHNPAIKETIKRLAYKKSEERRLHGIPGDQLSDWLEAEKEVCTGVWRE